MDVAMQRALSLHNARICWIHPHASDSLLKRNIHAYRRQRSFSPLPFVVVAVVIIVIVIVIAAYSLASDEE